MCFCFSWGFFTSGPFFSFDMVFVLKYVDFDQPFSIIAAFDNSFDAEDFASWRRRSETDDRVRYGVMVDLAMKCPVINGRPFCFSVGRYFGHHRKVIAWFMDEHSARDYFSLLRKSHPGFSYDYLKTLF